jgi:phosphoribosylanthranilate isomerase
MINGIRLKICGITSVADAEAAVAAGADYLGFIFYPKSPRHDPLAQYQSIRAGLPSRPKVAVCVEPVLAELAAISALGFDYIQIHWNPETLTQNIALWVDAVGRRRLWLAPRLPADTDLYPELLPFADLFLLDIFHRGKADGTPRSGDWEKFRRHRALYPEKQWMLTGGLDPISVSGAVAGTGATMLDVNSGVEQAPGVKSPAKLRVFVRSLAQATKPSLAASGGRQ